MENQMKLLKILKHIGLIINILSYINFFASLLANKTNNEPTKKISKIFSKLIGILALNFNVSSVSQINGMPEKNKITDEISKIVD